MVDALDDMKQEVELDVNADDLDFFFFTDIAWILSTVSATISTFSSIFVIIFICRSRSLSNPYHKIMLFMSFWDVVSSLAIALNTIPMPADVHEVYPFPGLTLGNASTCTWQGFCILVGSMYTICSNLTLNVYYVCTIKYGMSEAAINTRLLPAMLGISTIYVITMSSICVSLGLFNPGPYEPFCFGGPYPRNCLEEDDVECIRGDVTMSTANHLIKAIVWTVAITFACILISMAAVVLTVFKTESAWRLYDERERDQEPTSLSRSRTEEYKNTRTALHQALIYIAAFLLTWLWLAIALLSGDKVWKPNDPLKLIFQPLQGFFNAAIFFASKVHILRKSKTNLTRWKAFVTVTISPSAVPNMLLSQIEAVGEDSNSMNSQELDHYYDQNPRIRRTGRLRSDMPLELEVESIKSNNTPSFDLSRAIASSKGRNVTFNEDGDIEMDRFDDTDPSPPPKTVEPKRRFYRWPPPGSRLSSSSVTSFDKIWNLRNKGSNSESVPKNNEVLDAESTTNGEISAAQLHDNSALSQELSSTGISRGPSTSGAAKSLDCSVLAELSFDDGTMDSRLRADYSIQGLSFGSNL